MNTINHTQDTKRVARNTILLYIRSLFIMVVSIYTSRVVLATLGVNDYGIYNVVGGIVSMFSMFSATFVSASQRFLSYSLGKDDLCEAQKVFSVSLNVHLLLAAILFFLIEIGGVWYLNSVMNIPKDRMFAANWVLQFSALTFVCNIINLPYNALVISKEKMGIFAYVSIYEVIMKLLIVYLLQVILFDKLIIYGLLMLIISISIRVFYGLYCKKNFIESKRIKVNDKDLYRQFLHFSGWNFLGSSSSILVLNGMGLIINYFCGVAVNAASGIANQVGNAVATFVNNFQTALKPQIVKSYAIKDYTYFVNLCSSGTRLSFYLTLILGLPFMWTAHDILKVWLKDVPTFADDFVRMSLLYIMMAPISGILDQILMSTGKIKSMQITTSFVSLLAIPFSILLLYIKCPPFFVYFVYIGLRIINITLRIYFVTKVFPLLTFKSYTDNILMPILEVIVLSQVAPLIYFIFVYNNTFISWLFYMLLIEISLFSAIWLKGLTDNEVIKIKEFINNKIKNNYFSL